MFILNMQIFCIHLKFVLLYLILGRVIRRCPTLNLKISFIKFRVILLLYIYAGWILLQALHFRAHLYFDCHYQHVHVPGFALVYIKYSSTTQVNVGLPSLVPHCFVAWYGF